MNRDDRVTRMWDFLVGRPEGATIVELAADQELPVRNTQDVVQALRDLLGGGDTINVVCDRDPDTPNGRWIYRLVGTPDGSREWQANQLAHLERRLITSEDIATSMVEATDGRTVQGRKARVIKLHMSRCLEDLRLIGNV